MDVITILQLSRSVHLNHKRYFNITKIAECSCEIGFISKGSVIKGTLMQIWKSPCMFLFI